MARFSLAMLWLVVLAGAGVACAADESRLPQTARSESLELPGLTAGCHVCEWRPKLNQMPAVNQCGVDDAGTARAGLFECGFSQDCQRECRFLRCGTD
ncbi:MAG TPA: hypothetical protein VF460_10150 [Burkholderiales bacterium]